MTPRISQKPFIVEDQAEAIRELRESMIESFPELAGISPEDPAWKDLLDLHLFLDHGIPFDDEDLSEC